MSQHTFKGINFFEKLSGTISVWSQADLLETLISTAVDCVELRSSSFMHISVYDGYNNTNN